MVVIAVGITSGMRDEEVAEVSNSREQVDLMTREIRASEPRRAPVVATPTVAPPVEAPPPAAPVYEAPVASSVVQAPSDRMELANLVASYFPDDGRMSGHVVWAESMGDWAGEKWRCYVYGPCMSPTGDCGLMQVHWPIHGGKFGWDLSQCFDPVRNVQVARQIYDSQGPCAWASYGC